MRFIKRAFLAIIAICFLYGPAAHAIDVEPPVSGPAKTDSPIIITGYVFQGPRLYYIQLFNTSDEVVDISGWKLQYEIKDIAEPVEVAQLDGLLKPGGYAVIADGQAIPNADITYELTIPSELTQPIKSLELLPAKSYLNHTAAVKVNAEHDYWKRNISTSTGNYLSTFTAFTPDESFVLYGKGFYDYPQTTLLQVTEVLANPKGCSPLDIAGDCLDYVKFYNPTDKPIDLSHFRLRVGYMGQNPSSSNTFTLGGVLSPGYYAVIAKSVDDQPVSITNSGGFIWLEDTYGLTVYERR